jgi:hypothetical protein
MPELSSYLDLSLMSLTLDEIVANYWILEKRIQEQAYLAAVERLPTTLLRRGEEIVVNGVPYLTRVAPQANFRSLSVALLPVVGSGPKLQKESIKLCTCGEVGVVEIEFPNSIRRVATQILRTMGEVLRAQYAILEKAFLRGCANLYDRPLLHIEEILEAGFAAADRTAISRRVVLSLTHLDTKEYGFKPSAAKIELALERFKVGDIKTFTPLEGAIALVVDSSLDTFMIKGMITENDFARLSYKAIFAVEGVIDLTLAQSALFGKDRLSVIELCRNKYLSLQANCPVELEAEVKPVLKAVRKDVELQFRRNTNWFSRKRAELAVSWKKAQKAKGRVWRAVKEIIIEMLPKILVEAGKAGMGMP